MPENNNPTVDISRLSDEGVLFHCSFKKPTFQMGVKPYMVGLSEQEFQDRKIRLGTLDMLGDQQYRIDEFKNLAARWSANTKARSLRFGDLFDFIPNAKIQEQLEDTEATIEEWDRLVLRFMADLNDNKDLAAMYWEMRSREMKDRHKNPVFTTEDDRRRFVDLIIGSFPTHAQCRKKFHIGYLSKVITISNIETREEIRTLKEQNDITKARERMIQQTAQEEARQNQQFLRSAVAQVRTQLVEELEKLKLEDKVQRGKVNNQKTLNAIKDRFDELRQLNFLNDQSLNQLIDTFEGQFLNTSSEEYRNSDEALAALSQGVSSLVGQARDLANADVEDVVQSFGQVGRRRIQLNNQEDQKSA